MILKIRNKIKHIVRKQKLVAKVTTKQVTEQLLFAKFSNGTPGFFFPYRSKSSMDIRQLVMLSKGYADWMLEKYSMDELKIKTTDVVIDCGAFVGGFTVAAATNGARQVYSVEPSSKNHECLARNVKEHGVDDKVKRFKAGLGEEEKELILNLSKSGCDDSFLDPDEGDLGEHEVVPVMTLKGLIEQEKIDPKNLYLKVEAEGFEPEVIKGLGAYMPRVVTIDITPERDGESPETEIKQLLRDKGYTNFKTSYRCLFAYR